MFLEYHDARRMLDTTVVVYEGRLTYITKVNIDNTVDMVDCETGERFIGMADFEKIENPANSRIGYINSARFAHDAAYIVRASTRIYRMGYSLENLRGVTKGKIRAIKNRHLGPLLERMWQAYHNIYPTFPEAVAIAKETGKSVAYDRSFAVDAGGRIHYQSYVVGHCADDNESNIKWNPLGKAGKFQRVRPKLNWRE